MRRREFLVRSASGLGAAWLSSKSILNAIADQTLPAKFSASDTVTLGNTGIKTSRLAMGTGTVGSGHHSHQTALGVKGLSDLLLNGHDHGLRFFDSADSYGSHQMCIRDSPPRVRRLATMPGSISPKCLAN